jgi:hypothetical protein
MFVTTCCFDLGIFSEKVRKRSAGIPWEQISVAWNECYPNDCLGEKSLKPAYYRALKYLHLQEAGSYRCGQSIVPVWEALSGLAHEISRHPEHERSALRRLGEELFADARLGVVRQPSIGFGRGSPPKSPENSRKGTA